MGLETDVVRNDYTTVFQKIQEILKNLFKNLSQRIISAVSQATRFVANKIYDRYGSQKKAVLKDGTTKEVDRTLQGLDYDELQDVVADYTADGTKFYVHQENNFYKSDKKTYKTKAQVENFRKARKDLDKAKQKLSEKPNNQNLQKKVTQKQAKYNDLKKKMDVGFIPEKYDDLVKQKCSEKFGVSVPNASDALLTNEEKADLYRKACTGEPFRFTVVTNKRYKDKNTAKMDEVHFKRAQKAKERVNKTVDPKESESVKDEFHKAKQEKYANMFVDKEKFEKAKQQQSEEKGSDLTEEEIYDLKESCKYQTVSKEDLQKLSNKEGKGYTVYSYSDFNKAEEICKSVRDKSDIEDFACETRHDDNGDFVDIYVKDNDDALYDNSWKTPQQGCCSTVHKDGKSILPNETYNSYQGTKQVTVDNISLAKQTFSQQNYQIKYDENNKATFVFDSLTSEQAEQMFNKEHGRDAVAETGERIYEREKSELKSHLNSPAPEHQLSKIKEMADNNNKAAQDYINNYNECVELNNNNSLSVEQLKEFNNAYSSSNLSKKPNSTLDDYKNNLASQGNNTANATNNKPLADNEIEVKDDVDFDLEVGDDE